MLTAVEPRALSLLGPLAASLALLALTGLPENVWAAGGGGEGGEHTGEALKILGLALLNFVILVGVLRRYAWAPIKYFLFQRSENIRNALEASQRKLAEAQAEIARLNQRMAALDRESEALVQTAREQAELERHRLEQRAQETAERLRTDAHRVVQVEVDRARQALREEAVQMAEAMARDLIRERVTSADDDRLIEDFAVRIEGGAH